MRTFRRISSLLFVVLVLAACAPGSAATPAALQFDNPYPPQAGDSALMRGDIKIDSASVSLAESHPAQVKLSFAYFQPTPCYQLRVKASQPDQHNRIDVSAYAVAEKDKACTLMALATPLQAAVNLGSFPSGHYSVWLNGSKVGEFDS